MPIYEYQCEKCGHHLEALQKIADKPLRECPECGKHRLKRLMSAPLFRLAGSGWYETDFKSDKENKRNLAEKGETEPAKAETQGGTEAKADAKAEAKPATGSSPEKPARPESTAVSRRGAAASLAPKAASKPAAKSAPTQPPKPAAKPAARSTSKPAARGRAPSRGARR